GHANLAGRGAGLRAGAGARGRLAVPVAGALARRHAAGGLARGPHTAQLRPGQHDLRPHRAAVDLMAKNWWLPEGIDEWLPPASWRQEALRRSLLDLYRRRGYGLVATPL